MADRNYTAVTAMGNVTAANRSCVRPQLPLPAQDRPQVRSCANTFRPQVASTLLAPKTPLSRKTTAEEAHQAQKS
ncbi:hypothetical protein RB213_011037 [Colletotrichum asianum]